MSIKDTPDPTTLDLEPWHVLAWIDDEPIDLTVEAFCEEHAWDRGVTAVVHRYRLPNGYRLRMSVGSTASAMRERVIRLQHPTQ